MVSVRGILAILYISFKRWTNYVKFYGRICKFLMSYALINPQFSL